MQNKPVKPRGVQIAAFAVGGVLAVACAYAVLLRNNANKASVPTRIYASISVVLAARNIAKGTKITSDEVEERLLPQDKIPAKTVTAAYIAIGKSARRDISQGDFINIFDLMPLPPSLEKWERELSK